MHNYTAAIWRTCVTEQGIGCKLPDDDDDDDDTKVSKYVGVKITQIDCCDMCFYDITVHLISGFQRALWQSITFISRLMHSIIQNLEVKIYVV